jgi:hypothetical protein
LTNKTFSFRVITEVSQLGWEAINFKCVFLELQKEENIKVFLFVDDVRDLLPVRFNSPSPWEMCTFFGQRGIQTCFRPKIPPVCYKKWVLKKILAPPPFDHLTKYLYGSLQNKLILLTSVLWEVCCI